MEFGNKLKKARTNAKMTQARLAELVGVKGKQAVSNWEHGLSHPDLDTIALLARHLGVPVDYFFLIDDDEDTKIVNFKFDLNTERGRRLYNTLQEEAKKHNRSLQEEVEIALMEGYYIHTYLKKKQRYDKA